MGLILMDLFSIQRAYFQIVCVFLIEILLTVLAHAGQA